MAKQNRGKSSIKKNEQRQQMMIYGAALVLIILIAAALAYTILDAPPTVSAERLALESSLGGQQAPVTIIEYGAYGCHSCRAAHQSGILQQILATHGDNVRLVFRNFPVISPQNDPLAAEAAQCALDQGDDAFWTLHETLFDLSDAAYAQMKDRDDFVQLASSAGLDDSALADCLAAGTHQRTVDHWEANSRNANVRATPTFFVNGRLVGNPSQLEEIVRSELGL